MNVRFQIWDETDTILIAEGSTGAIEGSFMLPEWVQYGIAFETLPDQKR